MAARTNAVKLSDRWKDALRASMLHKKLTDHIDGKIVLEATQVRAIELILQRCVPTLTAVEMTSISPDEALTEDQILGKLSALLDQYPDLLQRALAAKARAAPLSGVAPIPNSPIDDRSQVNSA